MKSFNQFLKEASFARNDSEHTLGSGFKRKKYKNKKPGSKISKIGAAAGSAVGAAAGWLTHGTHGAVAGAAIGGAAGYKAGKTLSNIKRAAKNKVYLRKRAKRNS